VTHDKPLRILVSNPSLRLGVGGRDDYLVPLIAHLAGKHRLIATVDEFVPGEIPFEHVQERGSAIAPDWAWRFSPLWVLNHLTKHLKALRDEPIDVILTSGILDVWAASRALPHIPVVLIPASFNSAVDSASYFDDKIQRLFAYWFARSAQKNAMRHAACTVSFSETAVDAWSRWFGVRRSKFVISPYGIDLERFSPRQKTKAIHSELGLPGHARILLAVGRLAKLKRIDFLVRSLADERMPKDAYLVVAGDGPERRAIERLANKLGISDRIFLLGFRDDIEVLMNEADLFVHSSCIEYYPIVFAQALASGLPVICFSGANKTNVNSEIIADLISGRVVNIDQQFVPSIVNLINDYDLLLKMSINARLVAERRYQCDSHYQVVESVLIDMHIN